MGIADFGVSPSGSYQYNTTAFMGTIDIYSLVTRNATGDPWMGFQLNVVLIFSDNNIEYSYWVQNVAQIDTSASQIWYIDNIWNFTSNTPGILASAVTGNGVVDTFNGTGFYWDAPNSGSGNGITLTYPATVTFLVTAGLNSQRQPVVTFAYNDGSGFVTYDTVTFIRANHVSAFKGFVVDGNNYNPLGLFYDAELVLGGPGGGLSTSVVQSDLAMGLYYFNGHNYQAVSSSYNFGSNTGEAIFNANSQWYYYKSTGSLTAEVMAGVESLSTLYDQSRTSTIDIQTTVNSGILYVSNASNTAATPHQSAFKGGRVTVTIYPGVYLLQLYVNGALYDSTTKTVTSGQTLSLTSPLGDVQVTMSYSVSGGSAGFAPPTLKYSHGGAPQTATLTTAGTAYYMDPGTPWSVTANYTTATERWITTQQTSGTATSYQTIQLSYQHQYRFGFTYDVVGGGTGYSLPMVHYSQFGVQATATANSSVWVDAGSTYSYPPYLAGSTSTERWETTTPNGMISGSGTVLERYYHQYALVLSYAVVGGGSPAPPGLGVTQFGQHQNATLGTTPVTYFVDAGSSWGVPNPLPESSSQERWYSTGQTSGTASSSSVLVLSFSHQYYVSMSASPSAGGNVSNLTGWHDEGSTLQLSVTPSQGWKFEGWSGSGTGAYTGNESTSSIDVGAPLSEQATFYPGLDIASGSNGQVSYSFGANGGTVQPGSSVIVYAPVGTVVTLKASPSSFLYDFAGWSLAASGAAGSTTLTLTSPSSVHADFSISLLVVGGIVGAVLVVALVSALVLRSRRRSPA